MSDADDIQGRSCTPTTRHPAPRAMLNRLIVAPYTAALSPAAALYPPQHSSCAGRGTAGLFSPFVPMPNDSESPHADPTRTSLALSNRLAGNQPDRSLSACGRPMRTLQAPPRSQGCATRWFGWHMVGPGCTALARRSWAPFASPAHVRSARRCSRYAQTRLPSDSPSQPRSELQRASLAQSCCALSSMPHDPRCGGTPSAQVVERIPATRSRRPVHRSVLERHRPAPGWARLTRRGLIRSPLHQRGLLVSEARMPLRLRFQSTGASGHDRVSANIQDSFDAETSPRR
ncbi:hypothetical protein SAMN05216557_107130 [Sphingomonas carotinifaciens]|uniref:Uncharacterized protein n=1 Tax=Sphingomonas carotinifaciens TaxID=1166323 RepID=A0A1G7PXZ8_9SPHN|nr:hypothetical protein [Sphingomonas carotinifaciens]SDF91111.1 hypothetical protein SAMN05216557_107130 [Sphingomonas carotinifaciens]